MIEYVISGHVTGEVNFQLDKLSLGGSFSPYLRAVVAP